MRQRGDQIVTVEIVVPQVQDERSKEILREFAKLNPEDPRGLCSGARSKVVVGCTKRPGSALPGLVSHDGNPLKHSFLCCEVAAIVSA